MVTIQNTNVDIEIGAWKNVIMFQDMYKKSYYRGMSSEHIAFMNTVVMSDTIKFYQLECARPDHHCFDWPEGITILHFSSTVVMKINARASRYSGTRLLQRANFYVCAGTFSSNTKFRIRVCKRDDFWIIFCYLDKTRYELDVLANSGVFHQLAFGAYKAKRKEIEHQARVIDLSEDDD
jgi:hypothetical protein